MLDFIYGLYKDDHFTLYLTIILVVLIILFFVILIFGKKDQKLEETKKLQKLELDGFKDESKKEKVEVNNNLKIDSMDEEIDLPSLEKKTDSEDVNVTIFEPGNIERDASEEIFSMLEETQTDIPALKFDEEGLKNDLKEIEEIKNKFDSIELPKMNGSEPQKSAQSEAQVFSSVYVNEEETEELPTAKVIDITPEKTYMSDTEDEDMDLPTLK